MEVSESSHRALFRSTLPQLMLLLLGLELIRESWWSSGCGGGGCEGMVTGGISKDSR